MGLARGSRSVLGLALIAGVIAAAPRAARADVAPGWRWGALPILNFDADAGLGLGALGTATRIEPGVRPYRAVLTAQVFVTSRLVQGHELRWDVLEVGDPRLRLFGRIGYFASLGRNYCGTPSEATCDDAVAEAAAGTAGLVQGTDDWDAFVRHYYRRRLIDPFGIAGARWRLDERGRFSLFGLWRVSVYLPGSLTERGPYPGSFYATRFPDGERGVASIPQVGAMFDTRDDETVPTRGFWIEASARAAGRATGSAWTFVGGNLTARAYHAVGARLVSATRVVADVAAGDLPVEELGQVGAADGYAAFGGESSGRGIREFRYVGRVKLFGQEEARLALTRRWGLVGFVEVGWVADGADDTSGVLACGGAGLRWLHNAGFLLRADVGFSPLEGWGPRIYLNLGHVY